MPLWTDHPKANILVDSNHTACLTDFGFTNLLGHPLVSTSMSTSIEGETCPWMAPELFSEKPRPSKQSDVYALGMVAYEVCCTLLPGDLPLMNYPRRS